MCNTVKKDTAPRKMRNNAGFTLIEMAVVTIIVGLVIAAAAQLMHQREIWLRTENTRLAVVDANEAITAFRNTYGRYPCPASLTATPDDPATAALYGIESDCLDTATVASGSGVHANLGYAVVPGGRLITYDDRSTDPPTPVVNVTPRVRIGTLPFKNLNMEESEMYDGYRNRLVYAVTEQLGVAKTFQGDGGGITILNDQDVSIIEADASGDVATAHFIIFSPGENGAGAYTQGGARLACATTSMESENCNFDTDSVFRFAQNANLANGQALTFDDVVSYASHEDIPLWEKNPAGKALGEEGENDVGLKTTGSLGIGPTASKTPTEDVQVEGVIIARDDPYTTDAEEGNVESETICDYSGGTATCFPSSLLAGDLQAGAGMSCPAGQFMVGIKNGAPVCQTEVRIDCPGGRIAVGIKSDGSLDCAAPPPGSCSTQVVNICSNTATLPATQHNQRVTVSASTAPGNPGGTRYAEYQCRDGSWRFRRDWGDPCSCTPQTNAPQTTSCATGSSCGDQYSGDRQTQATYTCPSGTWNTTVIDDSACTCISSVRTDSISCPSGFNGGRIYRENRNDCSQSPPRCSGWTETSRDCSCSPETNTRKINCPSGLTGKIDQEQKFTCPGGSSSPGSWGSWQNVGGQPNSAFCTCKDESYIDKGRNCPTPGHVGDYWVEVKYTCSSSSSPGTWSETVVKNTCEQPPPVTCQWKMNGTGGTTSDKPLAIRDGDLCECGTEKGDTKSCSKSLGGGSYKYSSCTCQ